MRESKYYCNRSTIGGILFCDERAKTKERRKLSKWGSKQIFLRQFSRCDMPFASENSFFSFTSKRNRDIRSLSNACVYAHIQKVFTNQRKIKKMFLDEKSITIENEKPNLFHSVLCQCVRMCASWRRRAPLLFIRPFFVAYYSLGQCLINRGCPLWMTIPWRLSNDFVLRIIIMLKNIHTLAFTVARTSP